MNPLRVLWVIWTVAAFCAALVVAYWIVLQISVR